MTVPPPVTRCHIALGGNEGDVPATFTAALRRLDGPDLRVTAVSRLYETPPMGAAAGGTFVNAAATAETTLGPLALLDCLLAAEDALGRVRTVRWGPRPIDLDLVLFGDAVIDTLRLRVPHPAFWFRRFVLDPLAEIAPEAVHPEIGETATALRDRLTLRPLRIAVTGPSDLATTVAEEIGRANVGVVTVPAHSDPMLTLHIGSDESDPRSRVIVLPPEDAADAAVAVLAAVAGEPRPLNDAGWPPAVTAPDAP